MKESTQIKRSLFGGYDRQDVQDYLDNLYTDMETKYNDLHLEAETLSHENQLLLDYINEMKQITELEQELDCDDDHSYFDLPEGAYQVGGNQQIKNLSNNQHIIDEDSDNSEVITIEDIKEMNQSESEHVQEQNNRKVVNFQDGSVLHVEESEAVVAPMISDNLGNQQEEKKEQAKNQQMSGVNSPETVSIGGSHLAEPDEEGNQIQLIHNEGPPKIPSNTSGHQNQESDKKQGFQNRFDDHNYAHHHSNIGGSRHSKSNDNNEAATHDRNEATPQSNINERNYDDRVAQLEQEVLELKAQLSFANNLLKDLYKQ